MIQNGDHYSLFIYNMKYYLRIYLDNYAQKTVNKQMTDYFNENLFEDLILQMFYYDRIDIGEGLDLAKSNNSKECMISPYWCFNDGFNI